MVRETLAALWSPIIYIEAEGKLLQDFQVVERKAIFVTRLLDKTEVGRGFSKLDH